MLNVPYEVKAYNPYYLQEHQSEQSLLTTSDDKAIPLNAYKWQNLCKAQT
jgi:hypothetical protein